MSEAFIFEEYGVSITRDGVVTNLDSGKKLARCAGKLGYVRVYAKHKVTGKRMSLALHRLLALAFIPNPENKSDVNHKDGNKQNNSISNLEWLTRKENMIHASVTGLYSNKKPERNNAVKDLYKLGYSIQRLSDVFSVSETRVRAILNDNFIYGESI